MPKRSAILLLPDEVRGKLNKKLLDEGFKNYTQLAEWLAGEGFEISRSAIHRYGQSFEDKTQAIKLVTEQAKTLVHEAGDDEGALNASLIRLIQERLFSLLLDDKIDPAKVTRAVADLSRASVQSAKFMADYKNQQAQALRDAVDNGQLKSKSAEEAAKILGLKIDG